MIDDPFAGLIGSSRGRWWIDDEADESYVRRVAGKPGPGGMYQHMFFEDLSHLFPFRSNGDEAWRASVVSQDDTIEKLILDALPTHYGRSHRLEDGLRQYAEMCVHELANGPMVLEVEYFSEASGEEVRAFRINLLPNSTIWPRRRSVRQWVPSTQSQKRAGRVHYVDLDPANIVIVDLPRAIRRTVKGALEAFGVDDTLHQGSVALTVAQPPVYGFDVKAHRARSDEFARRASRKVGWDGRGLVMDGMAEPYVVWRRIQFARLQVVVRDTVIGGLQEALNRAGARLKFTAEVKINGILTTGRIDVIEAQFRSGTGSLSELSREAMGLA